MLCLWGGCQTNGIFVILSDISQFLISAVKEDHGLEVIVLMLTLRTFQTGGQRTEEDPGMVGGDQFVRIQLSLLCLHGSILTVSCILIIRYCLGGFWKIIQEVELW